MKADTLPRSAGMRPSTSCATGLVVRDLRGMLAAGSHTARYVTKLRKDLANDVDYLMSKVNGRISDSVNAVHL
jgi:hypothetical protein